MTEHSEQHDDDPGQRLAADPRLLDELHKAESKLTAVAALVNSGEPDWRRRCEDAAAALRGLLNVPGNRAGSWEASHVSALEEPLRDVLAVLEGGVR